MNGTEFLVSDDSLKSIGIDVERLLEQVAERQRLDEGDDLEGKDAPEFDLDIMLDDVVDSYNDINQVERSWVEDGEPEKVRSIVNTTDYDGVKDMLSKAYEAGFPEDRADALGAIVRKADIWRTKFRASDPPANVPPMSITLKSDSRPYRCASRKVNPLEKRFMDDFCNTLVNARVIWQNDQSKYCSPVNPVLKPEGKRMKETKVREWTEDEILQHFRLTIDYPAKKSAPEKRRSESDAALGREPKRARQDEGPKGPNNRKRRRQNRLEYGGGKGGGNNDGGAGGGNPPPDNERKPPSSDKKAWKGNFRSDSREQGGGRGYGRSGNGGRGQKQGRHRNHSSQNPEPIDRDAGYGFGSSEALRDKARAERVQCQSEMTRLVRSESDKQPEQELPASDEETKRPANINDVPSEPLTTTIAQMS
ncbi:hypothetical protein H310_14634 [Aphanomyces invadans]|uniref:Uncharacterized protein n=1 Tax=Aphanomyces invadans TaxID=157072 RepID=A0A024T983_9STRA|nr:hypothetical protein H310_14634 [Aphanomyces invadans]ETV90598.1 hypothetical protein H310_14634 [Aphanomyces invadans]|eukprot:XP_008880751.1 hypothetical protein H310_14634 [Aphanomyces invadans]